MGEEEPFGPFPGKVAISDLGCSVLALPGCRLKEKLAPNADDLDLCSPAYRAPNLCLGDQDFSADMDMWSRGLKCARRLWSGVSLQLCSLPASSCFAFVVLCPLPYLVQPPLAWSMTWQWDSYGG